MLVIIQVLIEKVMGFGGRALVTFIDYSKAFDSIRHVGPTTFDIMLELGFPKHSQSAKEYDKGASCPITYSVCTRSLVLEKQKYKTYGIVLVAGISAMNAMPTTQQLSHSHQWRCGNYLTKSTPQVRKGFSN